MINVTGNGGPEQLRTGQVSADFFRLFGVSVLRGRTFSEGGRPQGANVRRMIVRPGMQLALAGVVIGLALAFGLARVIATLLYGVTPRDPLVFTVVPLALTAVALVGVLLPARRAVRVDPIIALRTE